MSIHVMSGVWKYADVSGSELLILLALADYSNDDGAHIFPSVPTIARKARLSERQAQRIINNLVEKDMLIIVEKGGPTPQGNRSNVYRIPTHVFSDKGGDIMTPRGGGDIHDTTGGDAHVTTVVTPMSPYTSYNHHEETVVAQPTLLPAGSEPTPSPAAPPPKVRHRKPKTAKAEEGTATPHQELMAALSRLVFAVEAWVGLPAKDKIILGSAAKRLADIGGTARDVEQWHKTVWVKEWPGNEGQRPFLSQIHRGVLAYLEKKQQTPAVGKVEQLIVHENSFDRSMTGGDW